MTAAKNAHLNSMSRNDESLSVYAEQGQRNYDSFYKHA